jgi:hypothetical protein
MTLKIVDSTFTWTQFVDEAIYHAKDLFVKEMGVCIGLNELVGVKKEFSNNTWVHTIYVWAVKEAPWWQFFLKRVVCRNILRVTDILGPHRRLPMEYMSRGKTWRELPLCFFPPVTGKEPLKCELFLVHPGLRDIAQRVLEPLTKQLSYTGVEYIDASKDKSAWYPGEPRPELPEARLLER